jgi:hypothetical protein
MRIVSSPYSARVGLVPLLVGLALAWVFIVLWLMVACYVWPSSVVWSCMLTLSATAFALIVSLMTFNLIQEAFRQYTFEISETDCVLTVEDKLRHVSSTKILLLSDVKYAEYYPYRDSASIIIHTPYLSMEVPLWSMQRQGADVVDFLGGRGIKVVNVQSDEPIPD